MEEDKFELYALEYLKGQLSDEKRHAFEHYLAQHPDKEEELESIKAMISAAGDWFEEPAPQVVKEGFYTALADAQKEQATDKLQRADDFFGRLIGSLLFKRVAFFAFALMLGFFLGSYSNSESGAQDLQSLTAQLDQVRQDLVKIQLKSSSAYDRIQGVTYISNSLEVSDELLEGLLFNLIEDESVNIRIATAQALIKFQHIPQVSAALESAMSSEKDGLAKMNLIRLVQQFNAELADREITKLLNDARLQPQLRQALGHLKGT